MSVAVVLDALDLAALLCSRVCHDLISPAGAIVNGLEVLEEKDSDEETKTFALDLIKRSARTASQHQRRQPGNLKETIRVLQAPSNGRSPPPRYSWAYQKVQSSTGSTVRSL